MGENSQDYWTCGKACLSLRASAQEGAHSLPTACCLSGLLTNSRKRGPQSVPWQVADSPHPRVDSANCLKRFFPISSLLSRTISSFFGFFNNVFETLLIFKTSSCLKLKKKISIFPLRCFCLAFPEYVNFVHTTHFQKDQFSFCSLCIGWGYGSPDHLLGKVSHLKSSSQGYVETTFWISEVVMFFVPRGLFTVILHRSPFKSRKQRQ